MLEQLQFTPQLLLAIAITAPLGVLIGLAFGAWLGQKSKTAMRDELVESRTRLEHLRATEDALRQQAGQRGTARDGQARDGTAQEQQDPLGRNQGRSGRSGTQEGLLQGDDAYRRADELLNELRRRFGEQTRPEVEREYLERLLDRF